MDLNWKLNKTEHIVQDEWIDFRKESFILPDGKEFSPFYNYSRRNFVVIIARTKDDKYNRIGQILLVPNAPKIFLEKGKSTSAGKHGYNPRKTPEMKAVFYAWGNVFKNQTEIDEFQNVSVYPLVAEILGLKISEPIDGKFSEVKKALK